MIEFMERTRAPSVGIRATGHLTDKDYAAFLPELEKMFEAHGRLNVLFLMDEEFEGWDLKAAWDDMRLGLAHRADFGRLALVGGPDWVRWCIRLSGFLMKGEIRLFELSELDQAWSWIEGKG